jgi:hypothetical protein
MNPRRDFVVALLVLALTALACANPLSPPTETPVPTDTPEPTETPTPSPTPTPTVTPTPTPVPIAEVDLSGVTLTAADMPAGFTEMDMGAGTGTFGEMETANQFAFQYVDLNTGDIQLVLGFVVPVSSEEDQTELDDMFQDPAALEALIAEQMGGSDMPITSQEPLTDVEDIGEQRTGTSITTTMSGLPMIMDMLIFERGQIAIFVFNFYTEALTPAITVQEMGRTLDQRAQEALTMP